MSKIDGRIEQWKKRLLDLSKRNRLVNFCETKRSNLTITYPSYDELYARIINEEELSFSCPMKTIFDEDGEEQNISVQEGDLKTNKSLNEQQKTLKVLRGRAKTSIEEQGINALYLAFGIVRFKESDVSEEYISAPLILMPVSLTIESITEPYVLQLHDDEIVVNPSIAFKFENDYGIILPTFDDREDSIVSFMDAMREIAVKNDWEIKTDVHLTLLSFLKMNMYKDLDDSRDKIVSNPIVKLLSGDASEIMDVPKELDGNFDHDSNIRPIDTYQVVGADSSQQDAILLSKRGVSFILQGPPGTGKSQTITNIIAEAMAGGKKVLFVSEKMAALDVVKKRLAESGLEVFCLTLHSHKANKKEILAQLDRTLKMERISVKENAVYQLSVLQEKRNKLNQYCKELHTVCLPLGISIFEANGRLAKLTETDDVIFEINDVENTDFELLNQYMYLLDEFSKTVGRLENYTSNPWYGCHVSSVTHELIHDIEVNFPKLTVLFNRLNKTYSLLASEIGVEFPRTVGYVNKVAEFTGLISQKVNPLSIWFEPNAISETKELCRYIQGKQNEIQDKVQAVTSHFDHMVLGIDYDRTLEQLNGVAWSLGIICKYSEFTGASNITICFIHQFLASDLIRIDEYIKSARLLISEYKDVGSLFAISEISTHEDAVKLAALIDAVLKNPLPTESWFDESKKGIIDSFLVDMKSALSEIVKLKEVLFEAYEKDIFDIDYQNMLIRFKTDYSGVLRHFSKRYAEDRKVFRAYNKQQGKKLSDTDILDALKTIALIKEKERWVAENAYLAKEFFGGRYVERYTDWASIEKSRMDFERIEKLVFSRITARLKEALLSGNVNWLHNASTIIANIINEDEAMFVRDILGVDGNSFEALFECHDKLFAEIQRIKSIINTLSTFSTSTEHFDELTISKIYELLESIKAINQAKRAIADKDSMCNTYLGSYYNGFSTEWQDAENRLCKMERILELVSISNVTSKFKDCLVGQVDFSEICSLAENITGILQPFKWFADKFDDTENLYAQSTDSLLDRIEKASSNILLLEQWIDFRSIREQCKAIGLTEFITKVEEINMKPDIIVNTFFKRFYRLWLDKMIPLYPAVATFRGRSHEVLLQEFGELDNRQLQIARHRILERLIARLPNTDYATSTSSELSILKRELAKQKRIKPLRRLFREIPNLLTALKPCLMMSPLSVSLYLQADGYSFDMIIFDEASQVRTEDAIGAIMRGKQVVIAGDANQLPPTNFFTTALSDSDYDTDSEDDYDDLGAYDSVLEEAASAGLNERTLKWHYRSRHEHLIAFSNAKIYNHSLVTFPSNVDKVPDNGVEYVYVENGIYDRGGKKNNINEARKVAQLVFEHFKKYPNRTLGVVTFSESQQQAVENAVRELRLQHPQFERFFVESIEQAFFIKNLENVQGDERDTIIFSIGYAKDGTGKPMAMSFGPLTRVGGHRRLNVAITRAKFNVKLVGSIHPTDIRDDVTSEGVKMLRQYIEFAINGESSLQNELKYSSINELESPFEESVYDFLIKHGYDVVPQVGCSGYRIDMAVRHPMLSGIFVLGVECDGATYHSARTARERDRLRQIVLEDMGWKIHRIWSTDWIKDQRTEGEKLLEAVRKAISDYTPSKQNTAIPKEAVRTDEENTDIEVVARERFMTESKTVSFNEYEETDIATVCEDKNSSQYLPDLIAAIVAKEYPVHTEIMYKRLAPFFGREKATSVVRSNVDNIIKNKLSSAVVLRKGFLYPVSYDGIIARVSAGRSVSQISVEELAAGMLQIIEASFGIERKDLYRTTAKAFGFNRTGNTITASMDEACDYLLKAERIKEVDDKMVAVSGVTQ